VCGLCAPKLKLEANPADEVEDTKFKAPDDFFKEWADKHKANCRSPDGEWNQKSVGRVTKNIHDSSAELVALEPRDVPGRLRQFYDLLNRQGRQHDHQGFLSQLGIFFAAALLMGALASRDYTYEPLFKKMAGNYQPLFCLIVAVLTRPLFGDEHLTFYRECKTGISALGYFLAKQLYEFFRLYLWTLAYAIPVYYATIPLQAFDELVNCGFLFAWYWSGASNMLACGFGAASQSTVTLILIFWPSLEMLLNGNSGKDLTQISDMDPLSWLLSAMTAGRWGGQYSFAAELRALPYHVRQFTDIKKEMDWKEIPSDLVWAENQAALVMLLMGLIWRCIALLFLVLTKYAQGDGCVADLCFVLNSTLMEKCGCGGKGEITKGTVPDEKDISLELRPEASRLKAVKKGVDQIAASATKQKEEAPDSVITVDVGK